MKGKLLKRSLKALFGITTVALHSIPTVWSSTGGAPILNDGNSIDENLTNKKHPISFVSTLNSTAEDIYAGHRSHRSHSSHRSHYSSRGGGGGGGGGLLLDPIPQPSPRIQQPVTPYTRSKLESIILATQIALSRRGYYNGGLTGTLDLETKTALLDYQIASGLKANGRLTLKTLTSLGIPVD